MVGGADALQFWPIKQVAVSRLPPASLAKERQGSVALPAGVAPNLRKTAACTKHPLFRLGDLA